MFATEIACWFVTLIGDTIDLEDLRDYLRGANEYVDLHDRRFGLHLPCDASGPTGGDVLQVASASLTQLNGAAAILNPSYRPVGFDSTFYGIDRLGNTVGTYLSPGPLECRIRVGQPSVPINGVVAPDPRQGAATALIAAASTSQAATDALAIVGRTDPSWSELYVAFELVKANAGGRMAQCGWINGAEETRFKRTANSYTALGRHSRHGSDRGEPPQQPMSKADAAALIRGLTGAWLSDIASKSKS